MLFSPGILIALFYHEYGIFANLALPGIRHAAAVPVADGRADNHPKEISQAGGTAGIHGMTLCKTEKFSDSL